MRLYRKDIQTPVSLQIMKFYYIKKIVKNVVIFRKVIDVKFVFTPTNLNCHSKYIELSVIKFIKYCEIQNKIMNVI